MKSNFFNALTYNDELTENLMPTHSTSGNALVDYFYKMGAQRANPKQVIPWFVKSLQEDELYTLKALFYNRDVRGGQGERATFRVTLKWLADHKPDLVRANLELIPEYGRWDDLFSLFDTELEKEALELIAKALLEKNQLCAKWMPREGKANYKEYGEKLRNFLSISPRLYRKLLAGNTKVVETLMCQKRWKDIVYEHVPSVAGNKYRRAFLKNDRERYNQYITDVTEGKTTIKASAIFPHDIVKKCLNSDRQFVEERAIQAQWNALPNYVPEGKRFIPVCDVSGSMSGEPLQICIALGIYLSERNRGEFQDCFITFSEQPKLTQLTGSLMDRIHQIDSSRWGMNTNLEAVFKLILNRAKLFNLPNEDLPGTILILSDMQFDQCVQNADKNVMEMMEGMYQEAGYSLPKVVFWNLRDSFGVPVKFNKQGIALISGFSPTIMKTVLTEEMNPLAIVKQTLDQKRYDMVKLP